MSVPLSQRRAKFYRLVRAANEQTTEWLVAHLRDSSLIDTPDHRRVTRLSRLACLRVLACRDGSGQPYPERKRFVRERLSQEVESMPKCKVGEPVNPLFRDPAVARQHADSGTSADEVSA